MLRLLNRGSKDGKTVVKDSEYFVLPAEFLEGVPRSKDWGKVMLRHIPGVESSRDRWDLIRDSLQTLRKAGPTTPQRVTKPNVSFG